MTNVNHQSSGAKPLAGQAPPARPPKPTKRRRDELEFLPAAVEILETPASPAGRLLALAICAFLAIALGWSILGKLDIVAVAQGQLVPSGRTKVIQPLENSVVKAILVEDGQHVKAGEMLVELDPTAPAADRERLARDRMEAEIRTVRLRAMLGGALSFTAPDGADPAIVRVQQDIMRAQLAGHAARLAALDRQTEASKAEAAAIAAEIKKLEGTLPLLKKRVQAHRDLAKMDFAPKLDLLQLEEELVRAKQDLEAAKARLMQSEATIAGTERAQVQAVEEFRGERLGELAEAEQRLAQLNQEIVKMERLQGLQRLTSPVDGVVQQLAIHTVGGVVTEAQQLMVIVPETSRLEIEATLLNKDIGFVQAGQDVAIKLETFPFTRYGTIDGQVLHVSSDAVQNEKLGLVYIARIAMDRATMQVDGKTVYLTPGMAATVEVKTGKRRVIEYLLSPILRYGDESLEER
jgi:membrane fusion protein, hemolysin D